VLGTDGWVEGDLVTELGVVLDLQASAGATLLDATDLLVAPGLVDLQCNGGLGIDLAATPERIWELAAELPRFGVTAWLPTIVTSPEGTIEAALAALAGGPPEGWTGAIPVGLHLEGPFLSEAKRGAHRMEHLRPPSLEAVEGWSRAAGVALVTLAPDLAGAPEVIAALVERGVVVSAGHTPATAAEATEAVDLGVRWVTHVFNAMAPLHHREPGLAGVALSDPRLHVGLIPDGIHLHPAVVALVHQAVGDRLTIVTDAVAALGLPPGRHGAVTVGLDGVRLADGTLAGSNLAMDEGVRNLVAFTGCSPEVALRAASTNPARLLHDGLRGTLQPGARADLVLLTRDLHVVATVVGGEVVHDARSGR
jgi:N-acetylglucosamine-6-phosphate deacetylase